MKQFLKNYGIGFLIGLLLVMAFTVGICAKSGTVRNQILYNNIKIFLNGNSVMPTDANGKYVEPFIIDGTTYLPVRAIANALGLGVGWDGKNNTVILTTDASNQQSSSSNNNNNNNNSSSTTSSSSSSLSQQTVLVPLLNPNAFFDFKVRRNEEVKGSNYFEIGYKLDQTRGMAAAEEYVDILISANEGLSLTSVMSFDSLTGTGYLYLLDYSGSRSVESIDYRIYYKGYKTFNCDAAVYASPDGKGNMYFYVAYNTNSFELLDYGEVCSNIPLDKS